MFVWQMVSLLVTLTSIEKLPQVPLEKVPTKFRVVGTMALHVLVWFFFIYEFVFRARFLEWFFYGGLLVAHAYVFEQEDKNGNMSNCCRPVMSFTEPMTHTRILGGSK